MMTFDLNNVDVQAFIRALDSCKGDVLLITEENDRYNLKSKLSLMAGIMKLIEDGRIINAKICCSNTEDESMLLRLNIFGPGTGANIE